MRSQEQVEAMIERFDKAADEGEVDSDTEAVRETLTWVLHDYMDDVPVEQYLPID